MFEFQTSIIINRSAHEVFSFLTDPANLRHWRTEIIDFLDLLPQQFHKGTCWRETSNPLGKVVITNVEILDVVDDQMLMMRTITDNLHFLATYRTEPAALGTSLSFHIEAKLPALLKLVEPLIRSRTASGIDTNFKQLKLVLENNQRI
jgi:uncharacterized protein YndB with AHSA1/START domain